MTPSASHHIYSHLSSSPAPLPKARLLMDLVVWQGTQKFHMTIHSSLWSSRRPNWAGGIDGPANSTTQWQS